MSDDISHDLQQEISVAKESLTQCEKMISAARANIASDWKRLAGNYNAELLQSADHALSYLKHSDPNARHAAIWILQDLWRPIGLSAICQHMAEVDSSEQVRCAALISLSRLYQGTSDFAIGQYLANIVDSQAYPLALRKHAYDGLFQVYSVPVCNWPFMQEGFSFPDGVDWAFVHSVLESKYNTKMTGDVRT